MNQAMVNEGLFRNLLEVEHDSCGIICIIEKNGHPSRDNIRKTIEALVKMEHRSGFINGEGDGCGILTDIPRALWEKRLQDAGLNGQLAYDPAFSVGHIFVPRKLDQSVSEIQAGIRELFKQHNVSIVLELENQVDSSVLGQNGRNDEPTFWQIAAICEQPSVVVADHLYELHIAIESRYYVHVATLSNVTAAYKVMGAASILPKYFNDTRDPLFAAQVTIGHNRYSTNTMSNFFRVQPFSLLGHNGEINTVKKMRYEADMIGVPLVDGGSDSQDMNRTIETFIHRFGMSLFEAMELMFPPIHNEMKLLRPELQDLYVYYRQIWGHYAQGPAGIVSRYGNECVFSVDALGLRPVWMVESDTSLYFSSEQGVVTVGDMVADPKPIAPGEKIGVVLTPGEHVQVIPYTSLQTLVLERARIKVDFNGQRKYLNYAGLDAEAAPGEAVQISDSVYSAFGWDRDGIAMIETMAETGNEPIRSLGHDSPHAALNWERVNIPDFIKESVAVVTNPAIDRDREMEHFSTRVVIGSRPAVQGDPNGKRRVELLYPLLLEGPNGVGSDEAIHQPSLEQLIAYFGDGSVAKLSITFGRGQSIKERLGELTAEAIQAVRSGASLLVLDDAEAHRNDRLWLDPHLAVSTVDIALRGEKLGSGDNLRRHASIVLRSASVRSLHDIALGYGLGADAISPYLLFATASSEDGAPAAHKVFAALSKGLEKVISTIGTHELRGYTRFFSSIGLKPEVAEALDIVNYLGSDRAGTGFAEFEADAAKRYEDFTNAKAKASKNFRFFQRMWKALGDAASGAAPYADYRDKLREEEKRNPISIRHVADFDYEKAHAEGRRPLEPSQVDISIDGYDLPTLISSMSFGSQNETAFRAYAEAGERLNMVTMNGEGGEIKDMLGRYKRTRGAQVASGRFGINVELANAVSFLEIKIGQGAKPGEGGHLPGSKVTAKIAAARNATIGSDLISPSNNHDIYSIEDLAQIISELKEASGRKAKIIVKVPVVPGIGTIAVGVAKAGADVITLSGFDGGTGAARIHSITHVGLPTEIGTKLAHVALIEAGLRHRVELWSDGGMKSGSDVVKMFMLGANRVGFGSIAMQAIGCTTCRGCHLDTCHVGIATQIDSMEEAEEKGLRRFVPRVYDPSVEGLMRLFGSIGEEIREVVAQLGFKNAQELVGRSDLLKQVSHNDKIDLSDILRPAPLQFLSAEQAAKEAAAASSVVSSDIRIAAGAEGRMMFPDQVEWQAPVEQVWAKVDAETRILGSRYSSHRVRDRFDGSFDQLPGVSLKLVEGSVPGNGLAAFNARGVNITVQGGAEDGVGKMANGGKVAILKALGKNKTLINGSVGKSFGYGAQRGLFLIQGNADTRACIRFSGADVVFGGEITSPLQDELGSLASRANLKGFAFEYMTNGRAVVLGDPGPWICAGMTGGVIYQRLAPEFGLDHAAIQRRVAKGAKVKIESIGAQSLKDLNELLGAYRDELAANGQPEAAAKIQGLLENAATSFVRIAPVGLQADQSVATE